MYTIAILLIIINTILVYSFDLNILSKYKHINRLYININSNSEIDPKLLSDVALQDYLKGPEGKPWKGTKEMLKRKGQLPSKEYKPRDVIRVILNALQNNDEPQLDHGACVALEFKSPTGLLNDGGLDPAAYGRFLRSTDYKYLIDYYNAVFVDDVIELNDSLSVKQKVKITGWSNDSGTTPIHYYEFYLTKIEDNWLLDIILLCNEN